MQPLTKNFSGHCNIKGIPINVTWCRIAHLHRPKEYPQCRRWMMAMLDFLCRWIWSYYTLYRGPTQCYCRYISRPSRKDVPSTLVGKKATHVVSKSELESLYLSLIDNEEILQCFLKGKTGKYHYIGIRSRFLRTPIFWTFIMSHRLFWHVGCHTHLVCYQFDVGPMWLYIYPIMPIAKLQVYLTPDQYVRI